MRGQIGSGVRASRLRSVFVTVQVATCVLFLVAALAFVAESRRMGSAETGLDYERIVTVQAPAALRPAIAAELAARADVAAVSAAWRPRVSRFHCCVTPQAASPGAGFMPSRRLLHTLAVEVLRGPISTLGCRAACTLILLASDRHTVSGGTRIRDQARHCPRH